MHFQGLRAKTFDVQKLSGWQCHVATMVFGPLLISRSQTYKTCCAVVGSYIFHACIPRPFARSMKIKISICFLEPIAQLHLYLVHVYQSNTALRFCGIMSHRCDIHGTIPGRDCPPIFTRKFWVNFCFSEYKSEFWHANGLVPFTQLVESMEGKFVLVFPSIRLSWNFYQIISGIKY